MWYTWEGKGLNFDDRSELRKDINTILGATFYVAEWKKHTDSASFIDDALAACAVIPRPHPAILRLGSSKHPSRPGSPSTQRPVSESRPYVAGDSGETQEC